MRTRFTYANVVSTTALVVALAGGGTAVAAGLGKNTVGSPQIKNGTVKTADLGKDAVTSGKVRNNSLTGADIKEGTLRLPAASAIAASRPSEYAGLSNGMTQVAELTYTAPSAGMLLVTTQVTLDPADEKGYVGVLLAQDGDTVSYRNVEPGDVDYFQDGWQSLVTAVPVTKGRHTFTMSLLEYAPDEMYGSYDDAQIIVQFAPDGSVADR
ncbi:MAG: hypothetical protein CMH83_02575 [Nocardioides sp.]|nr:hypothetical protein [Nocardioides sp.]